MKIHLNSTDSELTYDGVTEQGQKLSLSSGGDYPSPMQAVLMSVAGCSSIDIELILKKMRQDVKKIEVDVEGRRREEQPRIFTELNIHYKIYGDVKVQKAEEAVKLSMDKYCSVSIMLKNGGIAINYSFEVIED